MTTAEIFEQFRHLPEVGADFHPTKKALQAAIDQRETITPELIAHIESVSANPPVYEESETIDARLEMAIYLPAQFREPRALDPLLRFVALCFSSGRAVPGPHGGHACRTRRCDPGLGLQWRSHPDHPDDPRRIFGRIQPLPSY